MKKIFKTIGAIVFVFLLFNLSLGPQELEATNVTYRYFFQHVTSADDGTSIRYTGCVNTGGTCWSDESMVQDCSVDGGTSWVNCTLRISGPNAQQ